MTTEQKIARDIQRLKADYASLGDGQFTHFFCPILLKDADVELCMGHVIGEKIPNSCRKVVVQRKDVDGFYGSLCESAFTTMISAHRARSCGKEVLNDPKLRRALPFAAKLGEQVIECYEAKGHIHPSHPVVALRKGDEPPFNLALKKVSEAQLTSTGTLQLVVYRDFLPETVATLVKMAHLTQFAVFGYRYVFGAAGLMLSEILRRFFVDNCGRPRDEQVAAATRYFPQHAGMILPALGYDCTVIKGSIEDRRFLVCVGSSGAWFAFGVFIRTDDLMHVVLVPTDRAESVGTYFDLIRGLPNRAFTFQLVEFVPATESEPAYWKAGAKEYTFRPRPDN